MKRRFTSQILGGLILIGIGAMFLLRQLGYAEFSVGYLVSNFWPVVLIFFGMQNLLTPENKGSSAFWGLFLMALGVFYLGRNLDWFDLSAGDFFKMFIPVMLIGGGLYVIFKPRSGNTPPPPPAPPGGFPPKVDPLDTPPPKPLESTLDEQFEQKFGKPSSQESDWTERLTKDVPEEQERFQSAAQTRWQEKQERHERRRQERHARHTHSHGEWGKDYDGAGSCKDSTNRSAFIGDVHMGREHFQLKNTNISQFIGDTVLDLTNAQIAYGETKINISAFIGDIKVYIPDDMDLGISVNSSSFIGDMEVLDQSRSGFMSSVQCKTPYYKETGKKVRINVSAFIGDIKVKTVG
ncbi:hypothetical protein GCM10010912_19000 [Paenibacillus albidus]|uniref:Cell wall-active antibiotics response protein n=1 Tax=Paenibacillus albidus TaxID=2041023 RepID=A0A917C8P6_9BACL|nr:cell wall-active antibiotics response protein LiaF [Paenibacillus albidus]GGF73966.1 hypothetical protein GCM10010912_19000 [Paenibacillus albidus]